MFKCFKAVTPHRLRRYYVVLLFALSLLLCSGEVFSQKAHNNQHRITRKSQGHQTSPRGIAYLIDFTSETYAAVTPDTIKRDANSTIPLDARQLSTIDSIISQKGGPGVFERQYVRLRVQNGTKPPIFVDKNGVVLANNSQYSLTPRAFVELDHFLAYYDPSQPHH